MRFPWLLIVLSLLVPATARAASTDGSGEGVKHVANISYPALHNPTHNQGTDLELAMMKARGKQRTFAFAGSYYDGLHVIDVSDPSHTDLVKTYDCGVGQGDVQVFQRKDLGGRWFATYVQDSGYDWYKDSTCVEEVQRLGFKPEAVKGYGTYILDITDPYKPRAVSFVPVEQGSHNQTVHPSGKYLYNSNADLMTSVLPAIEIMDIKDPAHPRTVGEFALQTFPGLGTESHDISFSADGRRAYVAALSHGEILDTTDPAKPTSLATLIDPSLNVWHEAEPITITDPTLGKRDFLIAEDEFAGAEGTAQCPNGGVHVYDITGDNEAHPVPVGYWNIDDAGIAPGNDLADAYVARCTAHVFQLHRAQQLMTIAYYNGGVRVVDLSGLVGVALGENGFGMKQLGWYRFPDSDTWAAKTLKADRKGFYFFGNDKRRGFDVYRFEPTAAATRSPGTWLTPEQALQEARRLRARKGPISLVGSCLLVGAAGAGALSPRSA